MRYRACVGLHCFDLDNFLLANERSRTWTCPTCFCAGPVEELCVDPWISLIVNQLAAERLPDDVVEFDEQGRWRLHADGAPWRELALAEGGPVGPQPAEQTADRCAADGLHRSALGMTGSLKRSPEADLARPPRGTAGTSSSHLQQPRADCVAPADIDIIELLD